MALLECTECSGDISSDAKICPHCGKRLKRRIWTYVLGVPLLLFGVFMAAVYVEYLEQLEEFEADQRAFREAAERLAEGTDFSLLQDLREVNRSTQ